MSSMVGELCCPKCNRDYEVPRRYMLQLNDLDFSPVPRLLPCLHSLCHSCLQEQFESDSSHKVRCFVCEHSEVIKGVSFLPPDINALKRLVDFSSASMMAVCSRCYDAVPSVSWCETCSSALCEFHHQDHRLSIDTAKHCFYTFKDRIAAGKQVKFKFPPLACPECPMQDCELYCHTCGYLVSARAGLEFHKEHHLADYAETSLEMLDLVSAAFHRSTEQTEKLSEEIKHVKSIISHLDKKEEMRISGVSELFNIIISKLKERRSHLIKQVKASMHAQRQQFLEKLHALQELYEEVSHANEVTKAAISNTNNKILSLDQMRSNEEQKHSPHTDPLDVLDNDFNHVNDIYSSYIEGRDKDISDLLIKAKENVENMYMISSAELIDFRTDLLLEKADKFINTIHVRESKDVMERYGVKECKVSYFPVHINQLESIYHTFGYLQYNVRTEGKEAEAEEKGDESKDVGSTGGKEVCLVVTVDKNMQEINDLLNIEAQCKDKNKHVVHSNNGQVIIVEANEQNVVKGGRMLSTRLGKIVIIDESESDTQLKKHHWVCSFDLHKEQNKPVLTIRKKLTSKTK